MSFLDATIVNIAFPDIRPRSQASRARALGVLNGYSIVFAAFLVPAGAGAAGVAAPPPPPPPRARARPRPGAHAGPPRPGAGRHVSARTRIIEWHDPVEAFGRANGLSGIDHLRPIAAGELPPPPIAVTLGFGIAEVEEGRVVFTAQPAEYHYNPIGAVHGGLAATLLDSAMGCAVQSVLPPGSGYTTLELKASFIRPMTRDTGEIRAIGTLLSAGRRVATAEGRIEDGRGRLLAHATSTCLVLGQ